MITDPKLVHNSVQFSVKPNQKEVDEMCEKIISQQYPNNIVIIVGSIPRLQMISYDFPWIGRHRVAIVAEPRGRRWHGSQASGAPIFFAMWQRSDHGHPHLNSTASRSCVKQTGWRRASQAGDVSKKGLYTPINGLLKTKNDDQQLDMPHVIFIYIYTYTWYSYILCNYIFFVCHGQNMGFHGFKIMFYGRPFHPGNPGKNRTLIHTASQPCLRLAEFGEGNALFLYSNMVI